MKILVTGATSFIGFHIVEELSKQGIMIRAAHRPGERFQANHSSFLIDGLDMESLSLDVNNRQAVFQAVEGCDKVFHTDYFVSFQKKDKARLYEINQNGTKNVMEACLAHQVEKIVYTSGMETLKAGPGKESATEEDGVSLEDLHSDYEKSRYLGEREVNQLCKQKGLPAIIVHPTVCLGKHDGAASPLGRYLLRYMRRKTHFYLDTGFNLIDVVDVAKGHLLASKRGEIGQRYILGNQNVYMLELLQHLEKLSGIRGPKTALPFGMAKLGNSLAKTLFFRRGGIENTLIERLKSPLFYDSSLARSELGLPQSNVWEALKRELIDLQRFL